jgi:LysR family transcriptional regulator, glycine cleavage system transcriptional activator
MRISPHILTHLPYLAELARTKSFTSAAQVMNITQAAMSYQIKALEEKVNFTLVLRQSGSQLQLTHAGELLVAEYQYCAKRLRLALEQLNHHQGHGLLKMSVPLDFGSLLMPKAIAKLKEFAPNLAIDLHTSDEVVNLVTSKWDMAIRSGEHNDGEPLYSSTINLVASASYVAQYGRLKSVRDLYQHTILMRENSRHRTWSKLLNQHNLKMSDLTQRITLGNTIALKEAARVGLGIALLPNFVTQEDVQNDKLTVLLPKATKSLSEKFYISKINATQLDSYETLLRRAFEKIGD